MMEYLILPIWLVVACVIAGAWIGVCKDAEQREENLFPIVMLSLGWPVVTLMSPGIVAFAIAWWIAAWCRKPRKPKRAKVYDPVKNTVEEWNDEKA